MKHKKPKQKRENGYKRFLKKKKCFQFAVVPLAWLFPPWNILSCFQQLASVVVCHTSRWTVIFLCILFNKGTIPWIVLCDSFLVFRAVSSVPFWNILFLEQPGYFPLSDEVLPEQSCSLPRESVEEPWVSSSSFSKGQASLLSCW